MNCDEVGCQKEPKFVCSIHFKKLCGDHYGEHSIDCVNRPVKFDPFKELRNGQIKRLNKSIAQIKSKITEIANELIISIRQSLKNSLNSIDQQRAVLFNLIRIGKPENQINEFLEIVPSRISEGRNSIQKLLDLEQMFSLEEFNAKVQEIEHRFNPKGVILPVNPVLESLEKLSLNDKISWCRDQNFVMMKFWDKNIGEIKISKNATFVFICTN